MMFTTKFTKMSVKGRKPPSGFRFAKGGSVKGSEKRLASDLKSTAHCNYSNSTYGPQPKRSSY